MPNYTLDSLVTPANGRAVLKFRSDEYVKCETVGVSIRDGAGTNLDYPGVAKFVNIGPEGYTYISDPRTEPLRPGTYTAWAFLYDNAWRQVGPTQTFTVPAQDLTNIPGKTVVFHGDNFLDTTKWSVGWSSAYPGSTPPQTDYAFGKADYIHPSIKPTLVQDATLKRAVWQFRGTRRSADSWNTPLVTTEYLPNGFEFLPGDTCTVKIKLPPERGAWPAIFTWGRDNPPGGPTGSPPGKGEVDLFEYHGDTPHRLEFTNHAIPSVYYYEPAGLSSWAGKWIDLRVDFLANGVKWYVNDNLIFTGTGVQSYWRAWPIVSLSVASAANQYHAEPDPAVNVMDFYVADFKVWR